MTSVISPERFRAWLEAQAPDAVVGTVNSAVSCPFVTYLDAQPHYYGPRVSTRHLEFSRYYHHTYRRTPEWLRRFIYAVDHELPPGMYPNITASYALDMLTLVQHGEGYDPLAAKRWGAARYGKVLGKGVTG